MVQQTKYNKVKEEIKKWINSGKVKPGEKIHSENELVKIFGVSRHTIRQAIGDLVHDGWLYREQGAGTFCSNRLIQTHPQGSAAAVSKNIGVITTYISDYIFPSIIKGIESYLAENGYSLTLSCTDNNVEKEGQCLQSMLSRNIDGLIVEPTKSSSYNPNINYFLQMEQKNIPYLMINQFYSQLMPPHIIVDDEKGGLIATEHLIKLGHEKIVGIFKSDDLQGVNRMKGFIKAFRENNTTFFPEMILTFSTEEQESNLKEKVKNFLESFDTMPTGIICYNDQIALSVMNVLRELQLSVPNDVSIVGYDDSYLAEATEVQLTSVTHPKMEMGREAAKWIVSAVENKHIKEPPPKSIVYEPELVIRNSTSSLYIANNNI
ncbi:GntR family transcriptional regulator [Neobacillus cucumis]|uniref:GntR family transcriptional regulator n=1 Tax=Neobacillus cucumis TaxID=1740721 RepID=UPI002E2410DA|nr:GntR family transcriptional regulator [Neobacillus cucumis]